jgi:hypothetical protein
LSADYLKRDEALAPSKSARSDVINKFNLEWRRQPYYFSQADYNEVHKAFWEKMRHRIVLLQLDPEETSVLVDKCRENGVTIISVTTAAFLAAYQDAIGQFPSDQNIACIPYDLRRRLSGDVKDAFCLFVGVSAFPASQFQGKNLWENARKIHEIIQKDADRLNTASPEFGFFDPTLIDACFNFAPLIQFVPEAFERTETLSTFSSDTKNIALTIARSHKTRSPALINTNIGRMDFPEIYDRLKLDRLLFVPPASTFTPLMLGGIGISGLVFSLNYIEQVNDSGLSLTRDMIQVRNKALQYLGFPEKANDKAN